MEDIVHGDDDGEKPGEEGEDLVRDDGAAAVRLTAAEGVPYCFASTLVGQKKTLEPAVPGSMLAANTEHGKLTSIQVGHGDVGTCVCVDGLGKEACRGPSMANDVGGGDLWGVKEGAGRQSRIDGAGKEGATQRRARQEKVKTR